METVEYIKCESYRLFLLMIVRGLCCLFLVKKGNGKMTCIGLSEGATLVLCEGSGYGREESRDYRRVTAKSAKGFTYCPTLRAFSLDALPSRARFLTPCRMDAKRKKLKAK